MIDPKERFSNRVDDYVRYRPSYPRALFDRIAADCRLTDTSVVAEIGSGTGIFARCLLDSGVGKLIGVEPNAKMRAAAEAALGGESRFTSLDGSAENTGLTTASIDLVAAAQAFHWFDPPRARAEFARILKPGGLVALVWNQRSDTPLNREWAEMLERFAPDYANVREQDRAEPSKIRSFFAPQAPRSATFPNEQRLDEEGLRGRLTSSSYAPAKGSASYDAALDRTSEIFHRHAQLGFVTIAYDTIVWYGPLA
jgi:SAM-dependent methyltransferase